MSSDPSQNPYEDAIKSLLQDEALVLYWKCKRYDHEQIAQRVHWSEAWVQLRMVRIYKKLGFSKQMHWTRRVRVLRQQVCPIFNELINNDISNIPKVFAPEAEFIEDIEVIEEENQEKSVIKVHQEQEAIEQQLTENEEIIRDLVLYDELREDEEEKPSEAEQPPPPIIIPTQQQLPGPTQRSPWWWILRAGVVASLCVCAVLGVWATRGYWGGILPIQSTQAVEGAETPSSSTMVSTTNTSIAAASPTNISDSTPTDTPEPTLTFTPGVLPTAVPLPIIENFNAPISDVWQITGEPIQTSATTSQNYDGVLTAMAEQPVSLAVGNSAWTDYIIHFRADNSAGYLLLGFRVQDLNNMLGIECVGWNCDWIVIKDGQKEVLSRAEGVDFLTEFTLTLDGENINGLSNHGRGFDLDHPFMVLPPKYEGQFLNGGVYIRFVKTKGYLLDIDYIEILPVR